MNLRRPVSPLSFEPLSPTPSDLVIGSSDSEDGLDIPSRAAKRRRIERLGQDYLEGRPPFILSAALKGPLENDWVNPWKTNKLSRMRDRSGSKSGRAYLAVPEGSIVPGKNSRRSSDFTSPIRHPTSRATYQSTSRASSLGSCIGRRSSKSSNVGPRESTPKSEVPRNQSKSPYVPQPRLKKVGSSLGQNRSPASRTSDKEWLKRDRRILPRHVAESPRIASPTPTGRPSSAHSETQRRLQNTGHDVGNLSEEFMNPAGTRISGFTPINPPRHVPQVTSSVVQSESAQSKAGPSSTKSRRPSSIRTSSSTSSTRPRLPSNDTNPSLRVANGQNQEGTYSAIRHSKSQTYPSVSYSSSDYRGPPMDNSLSNPRSDGPIHKRSTCISLDHGPALPTSNDFPVSGTISDGITSAQILPEHSKYGHQWVSLHSTDLATLDTGSTGKVLYGQGSNDRDLPQTYADIAQEPLTAGRPSPTNAKRPELKTSYSKISPSRAKVPFNDPSSPAYIKPFNSCQAQNADKGQNKPQTATQTNSNVHGANGSIAQSDLGAKSVQFGINEQQGFRLSNGSRVAWGHRSAISSKKGIEVAEFQGVRDQTHKPTERPDSAKYINGQADRQVDSYPFSLSKCSPHVPLQTQNPEESSLRSTGTALPFTLTGTTTASRQQDGQGIAGDDKFDLEQAIADA